jgi:hypothetical protein
MLVDGELSANWITTDIDGVREGMNMKLQECIHPGVFATCKSNEYCPSCGHMVPRELL